MLLHANNLSATSRLPQSKNLVHRKFEETSKFECSVQRTDSGVDSIESIFCALFINLKIIKNSMVWSEKYKIELCFYRLGMSETSGRRTERHLLLRPDFIASLIIYIFCIFCEFCVILCTSFHVFCYLISSCIFIYVSHQFRGSGDRRKRRNFIRYNEIGVK